MARLGCDSWRRVLSLALDSICTPTAWGFGVASRSVGVRVVGHVIAAREADGAVVWRYVAPTQTLAFEWLRAPKTLLSAGVAATPSGRARTRAGDRTSRCHRVAGACAGAQRRPEARGAPRVTRAREQVRVMNIAAMNSHCCTNFRDV